MLYTAGGCGEVMNPLLKSAISREIKYFTKNNKNNMGGECCDVVNLQ